jgi:hypothetical protein
MNNNEKDSWQTPDDLFEFINNEHGPFFWDACCDKNNCLVNFMKNFQACFDGWKNYDYLKCNLANLTNGTKNHSVFMNPPYSDPAPFIKKAWEDSKEFKVVILVPVSILSCKYMDFLDNKVNEFERNWKQGVTIVPLRRRTKFEHPTLKTSSPPGGCMLLILDRRKEQQE